MGAIADTQLVVPWSKTGQSVLRRGCTCLARDIHPQRRLCLRLVGFTGQKIRQNPVYIGPTCLGICLRNLTVEETTQRLMKTLGYKGILDIDYRCDTRHGQYMVLDVNPRIGCTFRLFAANDGMDVARALYLGMTGQPVPPAVVTEGRKWIVEDCDLGIQPPLPQRWGGDNKHWVRSFGGVQEGAFFSRDDPLPILQRCILDGAELCSRASKRIFRKRAPESDASAQGLGLNGNGG